MRLNIVLVLTLVDSLVLFFDQWLSPLKFPDQALSVEMTLRVVLPDPQHVWHSLISCDRALLQPDVGLWSFLTSVDMDAAEWIFHLGCRSTTDAIAVILVRERGEAVVFAYEVMSEMDQSGLDILIAEHSGEGLD